MNLFLFFFCFIFIKLFSVLLNTEINMFFFYLNAITIWKWFSLNCYIEFLKNALFIFYARYDHQIVHFSNDTMQEIDCFVDSHASFWILFRIEIESCARSVCNLMNESGQFTNTRTISWKVNHRHKLQCFNEQFSFCLENCFPPAHESRTPHP